MNEKNCSNVFFLHEKKNKFQTGSWKLNESNETSFFEPFLFKH